MKEITLYSDSSLARRATTGDEQCCIDKTFLAEHVHLNTHTHTMIVLGYRIQDPIKFYFAETCIATGRMNAGNRTCILSYRGSRSSVGIAQ
jgi:hypothetical protein